MSSTARWKKKRQRARRRAKRKKAARPAKKKISAKEVAAQAKAGIDAANPTLEAVLSEARGKVHVLVDANKTDRVDLLVSAITSTDSLEWAIFDTSSVDKIDQALADSDGLDILIVGTGKYPTHPIMRAAHEASGTEMVTVAVRRVGEGQAARDLSLPDTLEVLSPALAIIPLQLFAYHVALARGTDVDQPRNLAKSVTVE